MKYDEKVTDYMLLVASNLIVSAVSKNPEKINNVLVDIKNTIDSYIDFVNSERK
jgi:hypothetical protein